MSFYRSWTLWASCYRTDVLKRAYSEVVDERYTCNEDGYASFLIAYFANSYKVCDASPIYAYRVGSGLTSGGVTCEKFIRNLEISKCLGSSSKTPVPSRMEQKCSVRLFLTTPECAVFLPMQ